MPIFNVKLTETKRRTMVIEVQAEDEESAIAAALVESKTTGDAEWDLENEPINVDAAVVDGE
jgi:thiamine pyrophosphokinase